MAGWRETLEFVRSISRIHISPTDVDSMLLFLKKNKPWAHLKMIADMEGVSGLLYYHLKTSGMSDPFSKPLFLYFENTYRRTTQSTIAISAEVAALSSRFEDARIPVLALQGLSLLKIYRDPGLRPLGDADLMVRPGHKRKLKELLWETGYRIPSLAYPDLLVKDGIWVDIHTHILNLERIRSRRYLFPGDLMPMWENAVPFSDQSGGLLLLGPYDNFIALAAHALKHSYSRLIWLVDLHESLLKWMENGDGWERLVERTKVWQQEKTVLYALILLEGIFDLDVPSWVKQGLGITGLNMLEKQVIRLKLKGFSSAELCYALWFFNIKGAGKKLKFLHETLFPRPEIMMQIFPLQTETHKWLVYPRRVLSMVHLLWNDVYRAIAFFLRGCNKG